MSSLFRNALEVWLKKIDVKCESCLDVGGGQLSVKNRVNSWSVKNYKVFDNDAQYKPDYFGDLNYEIKLKEKFDIVFCLEVSEYLFNPLTAIQNLYNFLKKNGILYISFCTIYPLHNPPKIDYLRYTKNAIEKLLTETGFKTWEITPRIATDGARSLADFFSYERMRPMRGTEEVFHTGYMVKCFK